MPKVFEHMKSCHASHTSRRIWLDFDMDIKKECRVPKVFEEAAVALRKAGELLFGKGNYAIIKTSGGFHTLVRKECLTFNPNNFLKEVYEQADNMLFPQYVDEFVANDSSHKSHNGNNIVKRSALLPTPGCRQYDSYPWVVNKEDFE